MKKRIPAILLAIVGIALAAVLYATKQQNTQLKKQLAEQTAESAEPVAETPKPETTSIGHTTQVATTAKPEPNVLPAEEITAAEDKENARRRMMSSMAKMMENPTMNKVMEASQRGAVGALYADLIEYLDLNADETKYFMDLLMYRQMKQVDLGMKMMSGNLSEEEKKALAKELKEASDTVKAEMEKFLNNPNDLAEFEFYEKTMGERMMLSSMDQKLAGSDAALGDKAYRDLLGMMHDARENFDFTSDLQDQDNTDMSPERFSKENIQNFASDMDRLNTLIIESAQSMLTAEQLQAFKDAIHTTAEMQKAQLEMAAQMFGGGK